jgi:hypothetical protein
MSVHQAATWVLDDDCVGSTTNNSVAERPLPPSGAETHPPRGPVSSADSANTQRVLGALTHRTVRHPLCAALQGLAQLGQGQSFSTVQ